jgi:hypothetical protein
MRCYPCSIRLYSLEIEDDINVREKKSVRG